MRAKHASPSTSRRITMRCGSARSTYSIPQRRSWRTRMRASRSSRCAASPARRSAGSPPPANRSPRCRATTARRCRSRSASAVNRLPYARRRAGRGGRRRRAHRARGRGARVPRAARARCARHRRGHDRAVASVRHPHARRARRIAERPVRAPLRRDFSAPGISTRVVSTTRRSCRGSRTLRIDLRAVRRRQREPRGSAAVLGAALAGGASAADDVA